MRTKHIKIRNDKTQLNSRCRLCGDKDETINHITSEYCKLAQEMYKVTHDGELCKKLKFDHTKKWLMLNPESFPENETHVFLFDFKIKTDPIISARLLEHVKIN